MKKVLLGAALAALTLVPAASASRAHRVNLALVPLSKSLIGPAASSFSLAYDSGKVSNANAAAHTRDATPKTFPSVAPNVPNPFARNSRTASAWVRFSYSIR